MRSSTAIALAALVSLTACERIPGTAQYKAKQAADVQAAARAKDEAVFAGVRDYMAHDLKDPASAQFRGLRVVHPKNGLVHGVKPKVVVCGEINAKNSYGAYIGFMPFISTLDRTAKAMAGEYTEPSAYAHQITDAVFAVWWRADCGPEAESGNYTKAS